MSAMRNVGAVTALAAALLFGVGTPLAKLLLGPVSPWLLAGLLYLGSGIGLAISRRMRGVRSTRLGAGEGKWLAGAVFAGGVVAPVLLMWGLARMPASGASLLLNLEAVFTALLAWFVFHENFDWRILLGIALIVAGAVVLTWTDEASIGTLTPTLAVMAACLCWAIDNNLTRKVSLSDAGLVAMAKGIVAGTVNSALALALGATLPSITLIIGSAIVGFLSYGVSLTLFVVALRHIGAARTGAYFSTAPFAGALLAVLLLGESISLTLVVAGLLMVMGVWLHLTERHDHLHIHEALEHEHEHIHDEHHRHAHVGPDVGPGPHTHWHRHEPTRHTHPHFPDEHHRGHQH